MSSDQYPVPQHRDLPGAPSPAMTALTMALLGSAFGISRRGYKPMRGLLGALALGGGGYMLGSRARGKYDAFTEKHPGAYRGDTTSQSAIDIPGDVKGARTVLPPRPDYGPSGAMLSQGPNRLDRAVDWFRAPGRAVRANNPRAMEIADPVLQHAMFAGLTPAGPLAALPKAKGFWSGAGRLADRGLLAAESGRRGGAALGRASAGDYTDVPRDLILAGLTGAGSLAPGPGPVSKLKPGTRLGRVNATAPKPYRPHRLTPARVARGAGNAAFATSAGVEAAEALTTPLLPAPVPITPGPPHVRHPDPPGNFFVNENGRPMVAGPFNVDSLTPENYRQGINPIDVPGVIPSAPINQPDPIDIPESADEALPELGNKALAVGAVGFAGLMYWMYRRRQRRRMEERRYRGNY